MKLVISLLLVLFVSCGSTGNSLFVKDSGRIAGLTWILIDMPGMKLPPGRPAISLRFNTNGMLEGNAGCNEISGRYHRRDRTLRMDQVTQTRLSCPYLHTEASFVGKLKTVNAYFINKGRLFLSDEKDIVLVFERQN